MRKERNSQGKYFIVKGLTRIIQLFIRKYAVIFVFLWAVMACAATPLQKKQADSHINIGIAYLGSERYNDALREFLKAKAFTPREPRLHYYIGISYYEKGMTDKAIASFNQALSFQKDYSDAHNFLGNIYLGMGQWDKAIDSFKKALSNMMYETPDKALFNMGRAWYGKRDYPMARKQYNEAKSTKPNTIPLALIDHHMGMAYYGEGNYDLASQYFLKAREQAPAFLESRYWLGHCYVKRNDLNRAREEFKAVIKASPESELASEVRKSLDAINQSE